MEYININKNPQHKTTKQRQKKHKDKHMSTTAKKTTNQKIKK